MKQADHTNFISVLSEEKPVMVYFHHRADAAQTEKIKAILKPIEKQLPLLAVYEYVVDSCEENEVLAEYIEVTETPVIIFYKNGNFHRYKDKIFNAKSMSAFIGNKKIYIEKEDKPKNVAQDSSID